MQMDWNLPKECSILHNTRDFIKSISTNSYISIVALSMVCDILVPFCIKVSVSQCSSRWSKHKSLYGQMKNEATTPTTIMMFIIIHYIMFITFI